MTATIATTAEATQTTETQDAAETPRRAYLTKREIEVLALVIEGNTSKEVADHLYVSKRTVDFHLANLYHKLGVSNRIQAFREATRLGLIGGSGKDFARAEAPQ